jgi:hypothetical protein
VKRINRTEPIRRGRGLVVLRNRLEDYASGGEPAAPAEEPHAPDKRPAQAAVQAHLLGQDGQKRGLKGGNEVLDKARATYLEREFSGRFDRRPRKGRITKTEV